MNAKMQLKDFGRIVEQTWFELPNHNPKIRLDYACIMPNHIHCIIILEAVSAGSEPAPTIHPLSEIVRQFKTFSAMRINQIRNTLGDSVWNRNYFEHIIQNNRELFEIRTYIENNPIKWDEDEYK